MNSLSSSCIIRRLYKRTGIISTKPSYVIDKKDNNWADVHFNYNKRTFTYSVKLLDEDKLKVVLDDVILYYFSLIKVEVDKSEEKRNNRRLIRSRLSQFTF